jgi:hypothetical protein
VQSARHFYFSVPQKSDDLNFRVVRHAPVSASRNEVGWSWIWWTAAIRICIFYGWIKDTEPDSNPTGLTLDSSFSQSLSLSLPSLHRVDRNPNHFFVPFLFPPEKLTINMLAESSCWSLISGEYSWIYLYFSSIIRRLYWEMVVSVLNLNLLSSSGIWSFAQFWLKCTNLFLPGLVW